MNNRRFPNVSAELTNAASLLGAARNQDSEEHTAAVLGAVVTSLSQILDSLSSAGGQLANAKNPHEDVEGREAFWQAFSFDAPAAVY